MKKKARALVLGLLCCALGVTSCWARAPVLALTLQNVLTRLQLLDFEAAHEMVNEIHEAKGIPENAFTALKKVLKQMHDDPQACLENSTSRQKLIEACQALPASREGIWLRQIALYLCITMEAFEDASQVLNQVNMKKNRITPEIGRMIGAQWLLWSREVYRQRGHTLASALLKKAWHIGHAIGNYDLTEQAAAGLWRMTLALVHPPQDAPRHANEMLEVWLSITRLSAPSSYRGYISRIVEALPWPVTDPEAPETLRQGVLLAHLMLAINKVSEAEALVQHLQVLQSGSSIKRQLNALLLALEQRKAMTN